jgi:hypothetical protein
MPSETETGEEQKAAQPVKMVTPREQQKLHIDRMNEASPQQAAGYHKEGHCL